MVNPNMTASMTDRMAEVAARRAPRDVEIVPLTADRGFPYISSRAEAQIAGAIVLETIAREVGSADAVVIAAFGDPGLRAARDLFDVPVVGMAEAAIHSAAMLGDRFAIVTFSPSMRRWYADSVTDAGLAGRFAGVHAPPRHPEDVGSVRDTLRGELIDLCREAGELHGADVAILGGAPLAGLAEELQSEVGLTLVDPISAAVVQAIALSSLAGPAGPRAPRASASSKSSAGLEPMLAARFAGVAEA